jgi:hypothetical protein
MACVKAVGDWAKARRLLMGAPQRLHAAMQTAMHQEAHRLRNEIVTGLTKQAPGGEPIKPLAQSTLAARKLAGFDGTKALIERGDLRNAVAVVFQGNECFIGIPRKAKSQDGKSLVDLAELQEYGGPPVVIPITPRMRRFLSALAKEQGIAPKSKGSSSGVVVVRVPARPYLRPAFERWRKYAQARFLERVAWEMGFGTKPPASIGG